MRALAKNRLFQKFGLAYVAYEIVSCIGVALYGAHMTQLI
jgi:hypothetical protein